MHACHRWLHWLKRKQRKLRPHLRFVWGNFCPLIRRYHANKRWFDMCDNHQTGARKVISCETPIIGRRHFEACANHEPYFRLGLWNSSTLHRGGFTIPDNPSPDRLLQILSDVGETYTDKRSTGDDVLYLMQSRNDTSLQGVDSINAAMYDLMDLRRQTDRHVIVVGHPYHGKLTAQFVRYCKNFDIDYRDGPAHLYFDRAFCTVSQSSSAAIDGLLSGVPCVTLNEGSFARPVSQRSLVKIESVTLDGVFDWLCKLAYFQWKPIAESSKAFDLMQV